MMSRKNISSYISTADRVRSALRLLMLAGCLLCVQGLAAQNYVVTETAKQKAEAAKLIDANKPKKLVYAVEKKSFFKRFREDSTAVINSVQLNVDLVGAVQSMLADKKYYEASVQVSIKDWFYPTLELGYGTTNYHEIVSNTYYSCSAPYGKLGVDLNIMKNRHDDYRVVVGARAAFTRFKYDVSVPNATDPVWGGNANYEVKDAKCNYLWAEVLAGVDAKIIGPVHLGWTVRYKKRLSSSYDGLDKAWYVPGYGKDDSTGWGITFNVGIGI
ncbi:MAG: hypothetical protein HUK05_06425 [Prevotella sp.]|nr:hypothetical protein [Prevotella sp.]